MELKDRLKQARKNAKMTQIELAKVVKTTQGSIADLESGRNKSTTNLVKIAQALAVNPTWLATGQGEITLQIDKNAKCVKTLGKVRKVPIFNDVTTDIFTKVVDNTYDEFEEIYDNGRYHERIFYLRIYGDNMIPRFNIGNLILVDMDCQPKSGDFVVVITENNESIFNRLRIDFDEQKHTKYMQLIPLNGFYSVIDSRYQPFKLVGKVIEKKEFF